MIYNIRRFLWSYNLSAIDAQSIMQAMKDVFLQFQIPFAKLCGQCYDGYNTMAGTRAGVDHSMRHDEKHQGSLNKEKLQLNLLQLQKMNIAECTLKHLILQLLLFVVGLIRKVLQSLVMCSSYDTSLSSADDR